jgi:hypothetical protein
MTKKVYERKPPNVDWGEVAMALCEDLGAAKQGNIWLDGRLWALLHRVRFIDTHESPLTGIRQVHVAAGRWLIEKKWFDLPALTQNISMLWKTARQFTHVGITQDADGLLCINDPVSRSDWDLGLLLAQEACFQIACGVDVRYDLPENMHVRTRKKPKEIFLETWDARIKIETLNKVGGEGSKPSLRGNKNSSKKVAPE